MPTITQIEYILAVAQLKHFGKAALHCHVSQPSLSMQIHKAEEDLGIIIFDRNTKPISLTAKGSIVIDQSLKLLAEYKNLLRISRQETTEVKGDFYLGVIPTLSSSLIPIFVKNFSLKFPKVQLYINELTTENLISSIKLGEIDAGILATPIEEPNLEKKVLFYEEFSVYCSANHPLLKKKKLKVEDLENYQDLWILSDGHCFKNQVLNFCGMEKKLNVLSNIHFQSGSLETLKLLVENADGFTFLPKLNIDLLSPKEKSRIRHFVNPVPSREVSIVSMKSHWKSDVLNSLAQELLNELPLEIPRTFKKQMNVIDID
jgi:LysR family transcriptional regulator, hydrogen peroxide-inducible genes activator